MEDATTRSSAPVPVLDAVGFVVADMGATVAFYRQLGLDFPEVPADVDLSTLEGHVEAVLPGGVRLMFDTVDVVESFSTYEAPAGGHRMSLAFRCADPAAVDGTYASLLASGTNSVLEPVRCLLGPALRNRGRPGRQPG